MEEIAGYLKSIAASLERIAGCASQHDVVTNTHSFITEGPVQVSGIPAINEADLIERIKANRAAVIGEDVGEMPSEEQLIAEMLEKARGAWNPKDKGEYLRLAAELANWDLTKFSA